MVEGSACWAAGEDNKRCGEQVGHSSAMKEAGFESLCVGEDRSLSVQGRAFGEQGSKG